MTLRVVQWTTGNVGRRAARAIVRHPELDLVGCYAWSDDKVGADVGTLVGIEPIGVTATSDVDALLALRPDCVSYNPMWPDVDEMCRILAAGVNIVSTAAFITGRALGSDAVERLRAAALAGNATLFGTGVNPGFLNLFGLVSAGICDRVDSIRVLESVDATGYASAETQLSVGFAARPRRPCDRGAAPKHASAVFGDAVACMADALGVELDDIGFAAEYARATETMDLGFMTIPEGTVAGISGTWFGAVGDRSVIECSVPVEDGLGDGARLAAAARLLRRDRRRAQGAQPLPDPAARRLGRARLHGARHDHDRHAGGERDPGGVRRRARDRGLCRPAPRDRARVRHALTRVQRACHSGARPSAAARPPSAASSVAAATLRIVSPKRIASSIGRCCDRDRDLLDRSLRQRRALEQAVGERPRLGHQLVGRHDRNRRGRSPWPGPRRCVRR